MTIGKGKRPRDTIQLAKFIVDVTTGQMEAPDPNAGKNPAAVAGLPALSYTAKNVGEEVRKIMIKNSGVAPESLPPAEDISGVKRRLKSAAKAMKKMDGKKKPSAPMLQS